MSKLNIKQNTKDQSAVFFGVCDAWTTWYIHIATPIQILYKALKRLKNSLMCFFYKHHFCKQHQAEIWSKIIPILNIKTIQKKNKYSKSKTCLVKSITASKYLHYQWKTLLIPPPHHFYSYCPIFFKKILWSLCFCFQFVGYVETRLDHMKSIH